MENINELLGSVLSDPDAMEKLRETAHQLGIETSDTFPEKSEHTKKSGNSASEALSGLMPAVGKLAPLLGKLNEEDDMTRLIHALKPYLSGARLKRAEEADRIVSIMRVIPLLRQSRQEEP